MDRHQQLHSPDNFYDSTFIWIRYCISVCFGVFDRSYIRGPGYKWTELASRVAASKKEGGGCVRQDDDRHCVDHSYYPYLLIWDKTLEDSSMGFHFPMLHWYSIRNHICP